MKKLLIISSTWPQEGHSIRAANVVIYELLRALVGYKDFEVGFLRVKRVTDPEIDADGDNGLKTLGEYGLKVLDEVQLDNNAGRRNILKRIFFPKNQDFYPESVQMQKISDGFAEFNPDIILIPWSEWLTAACADIPIRKIAYYGNPDQKAGYWRMVYDHRHKLIKKSMYWMLIGLKYLERQHLKNMAKYDLLTNVAYNDAMYYKSFGHKNVHYVRNIWIDRLGSERLRNHLNLLSNREERPIKMIVNVGQLGATANRYGLEILGNEIAPLLRKRLSNTNYELHILGNGEIGSELKELFEYGEFKIRGFVDDIDSEILDSEIFICMNNSSPFQVCHTRYLHAWSLGACVVAHENAAKSIPEMVSGVNCLLGRSAEEVVEHVVNAIHSPDLRREIGNEGYKTFKKYFEAPKVADVLVEHISKLNHLI